MQTILNSSQTGIYRRVPDGLVFTGVMRQPCKRLRGSLSLAYDKLRINVSSLTRIVVLKSWVVSAIRDSHIQYVFS